MKKLIYALLIPAVLVVVAVVDGAGRSNLTGPDRKSSHTEIYVSDSAEVANGTEAGETVTVHVVNRGKAAETYVWFLSIDGVETRTGSLELASEQAATVALDMPDLPEAALAEFSLAGKPQTLRWKVAGR